jgi:hypothetical protein
MESSDEPCLPGLSLGHRVLDYMKIALNFLQRLNGYSLFMNRKHMPKFPGFNCRDFCNIRLKHRRGAVDCPVNGTVLEVICAALNRKN